MNYYLLLIILIFLEVCPTFGQNLFVETKSGFAFVDNERENYSNVSYIPWNISLGFGVKNFQLGGDLIFSPLPQTYLFNDEFTNKQRVRQEVEETYYGGFLRFNSSYEPESITGFVLKVGMGILNSTEATYALPSNLKSNEIDYLPSIQYLGEIGLSIPLRKIVHIYTGYGINYANKELTLNDIQIETYRQIKHIIQIGLSVNLNFQKY